MRQFKDADLTEFVDLIDAFTFTRSVTEVHLHHSWRPRQTDYLGLATIQDMWRQHTEVRRWSDIAQHCTVAPDGRVWLGRNFNRTPASVAGFNGSSRAGPFMLVMIGDFFAGGEAPTKAQMEATLGVIRAVQRRFGLPASALHLHGELSGVACPGSIDKAVMLEALDQVNLPTAGGGGDSPFPATMTRQHELLRSLETGGGIAENMSDAELVHGPEAAGSARAGTGGNTKRDLSAYRDHWINLDNGQFSSDGELTTTKADVDRIFGERLPAEIAKSKAQGRPLDLLFYAHGGLVAESVAIGHMLAQTDTWIANGVYPIFFVWETGFWRSVRNLLPDVLGRDRAARAPAVDWLLEQAVRRLGGVSVWGSMKTNAELANSQGGGALYAGQRLKKLVDEHGDGLRLHAVGHSAGSIFHAHFLNDLVKEKKYGVKTLSLLAPAIHSDVFTKVVAPLMKPGRIEETTIYTMNDRRERARDPAMGPYGKSLLYLIRGGLERDRPAEILGLEISLRGSAETAKRFGLNGNPATGNRIVFSGDPGSATDAAQAMGLASDATTHGGFDDDPVTMNSVLRRVTQRTQGEPIVPFVPARSRAVVGVMVNDFEYLQADISEALSSFWPQSPTPPSSNASAPPSPTKPPAPPSVAGSGSPGSLRALCIGIDDYRAITPLGGCRNDARRWSQALEGLGYRAEIMPQEEATAEGLVERIGNFIASARSGDSHILQFSGHGSQFGDVSGDEEAGPLSGDGKDEALCAIDCATGATGLVLDDRIRVMMSRLDPGASLMCFFDSCHSGTVTRARVAGTRAARGGSDIRVRSFPPNSAMRAAYAQIASATPRPELAAPMREVVFSACLPNQYAYERDGQGDFTRYTLQVLQNGGPRPTNSGFANAVTRLFGSGSVQTPYLDCDPAAREAPMPLGTWA